MALVIDDTVRLYTLNARLILAHKGVTVPNSNLCLLKTAIDGSGDVAVLYGQSATAGVAQKSDPDESFLLVYHQWLGNSYKPVVYPHIKGCKGYVPVSLAACEGDKIAVVLSRGSLSRRTDSSRADMAVLCYHLRRPAG